jgi:hypothetical protein
MLWGKVGNHAVVSGNVSFANRVGVFNCPSVDGKLTGSFAISVQLPSPDADRTVPNTPEARNALFDLMVAPPDKESLRCIPNEKEMAVVAYEGPVEPDQKPFIVKVKSASSLHNSAPLFHKAVYDDRSDPYVTIWVAGKRKQKQQTSVVMNDLNPVWNEEFTFYLKPTDYLKFTVKDRNSYQTNTLLGTSTLRSDRYWSSGMPESKLLLEHGWKQEEAYLKVEIAVK